MRGLYAQEYHSKDTTRSLEMISDLHRFDFERHCMSVLESTGRCAVLDIGCGNSTFLGELAMNVTGVSVLGADIVPKDQRNTYQHPMIAEQPEVVCSGNDLHPIADSSFDVVVSTWSVSAYGSKSDAFANGPKTYISEIARVLRPGGFASIRPEITVLESLVFNDAQLHKYKRLKFGEHTLGKWAIRRAEDYRTLVNEGYRVSFHDEVPKVRIHKPAPMHN